jgi:hypothetical protein
MVMKGEMVPLLLTLPPVWLRMGEESSASSSSSALDSGVAVCRRGPWKETRPFLVRLLTSLLISAEGIRLGRGVYAAAGGVRKAGDVGEVGSLVSSPEGELPSGEGVFVNAGQFHLTELCGLCTSTLVLALAGQAGLIDDGGRSGSLTVEMVSVAELRREHGVEGRSPL